MSEEQINAILVGIYSYVIRCMRKSGQAGVSAYKWMVARAEDSPKAMNLLRLVRDWEFVLMHRYSERNNDFDGFLSSLRLTLPLLTMARLVSYVLNYFDLLRDWEVRWLV